MTTQNEQAEQAFEKWWSDQEIPNGYGWSKPTFKGGFEVGYQAASQLSEDRMRKMRDIISDSKQYLVHDASCVDWNEKCTCGLMELCKKIDEALSELEDKV